VSVSGTGTLWAGGFAGHIENSTTINNCTANNEQVTINGSYEHYWAGGFVGEAWGLCKIDRSSAAADVLIGASSGEISSGTMDEAGGFAGAIDNTTATPRPTYTELSATGNIVTYHRQGSQPAKVAGGLVGLLRNAVLTKSFAKGNVTANSKTPTYCTAGGLVGEQRNADISQSYSTGNVYNSNDGQHSLAGGITGFLAEGAGTIEDCYSLGNVTAIYPATGDVVAAAGGILGTTKYTTNINTSSIKIRHCYAAGAVQAINYAAVGYAISGGIAGELHPGQSSSDLVYNVFLGPSVSSLGAQYQWIRFLYAGNSSTSASYSGYYWRADATNRAKKSYKKPWNAGTETAIPETDNNNLDGAASSALNTTATWTTTAGFSSSIWGSFVSITVSGTSLQRPKLLNNLELP
jgi:hypothetical protein